MYDPITGKRVQSAWIDELAREMAREKKAKKAPEPAALKATPVADAAPEPAPEAPPRPRRARRQMFQPPPVPELLVEPAAVLDAPPDPAPAIEVVPEATPELEPEAIPEPPPPPTRAPWLEPTVPPPTLQEQVAVQVQRHRRAFVAGIAVAGALALGGGGFAAFSIVFARAVPLAQMLPSDTQAYVSVNLDPSIGQKLSLLGLAKKFPKISSDADLQNQIDKLLDAGASGSDVSFKRDVRPWLGHEVAIGARVDQLAPNFNGSLVLLAASRDDNAAKAFVDKAKRTAKGKVSHETYEGVDIWTADGSSLAYFNRVMVAGQSVTAVERVVDVAQGKRSRLSSQPAFVSAMSRLNRERVAEGYLDLAALGSHFVELLPTQTASSNLAAADTSNPLAAARPESFDLVATSDSLNVDMFGGYDSAQLTDGERTVLSATSHLSVVLKSIPTSAIAVIGIEGVRQSIQDALTSSGRVTQATPFLHEFGLDDPNSPASKLGDDLALEVGSGSQGVPSGAVLVSTTDRAATQALMDAIAAPLAAAAAPPAPRKGKPVSPLARQTYRGVVITSLSFPGLPAGVSPAYFVTDNLAVVASSLAEARGVIDANATGAGIVATSSWPKISPAQDRSLRSALYFDINKLADAVVAAAAPGDRSTYNKDIAPYLKPLKTLDETATGDVRSANSKLRVTFH